MAPVCAVVNVRIAEPWVFTGNLRGVGAGMLGALLVITPASMADAAGPSPEAIRSWDAYVTRLVQARAADMAAGVASWATDEDPSGLTVRASINRGGTVISRREISGVTVDDATLEHWQGSTLLRGVSLSQVSDRLRHPERFPQPPDVMRIAVSNRSEAGHDLYLRLTRSMLVTATYDTWHQVRHHVRSATRIDSASRSTKIQEVQDAGSPQELRRAADEGRGFLWRMHSYWRFSLVPEGVVVTCESITLSRPVPRGLGLAVRPIIRRVARESMTTALEVWRTSAPASPGASSR